MDQTLTELKKAIGEDLSRAKPSESSKETTTMKKLKSEKTGAVDSLVLKRNLCYIVTAVIVEDGKVLMIKEAKDSCRGYWYLPAGKMKKNESLVEGVKREVLEESGVTFEPTSLICMDSSDLGWHRFTFTGNVSGGRLKSLKEQDKESLEARWFEPREIFNLSFRLRGSDIIPLIKATLKWKETKGRDPIFISMPVALPHPRITIQVVLVSNDDNKMKILLDRESSTGFLQITPITSCCSLQQAVQSLLKRSLAIDMDYKLHGLITVEHVGKPHGVADGACFTVLAVMLKSLREVSARYLWWELVDEMLKSKINKFIEKGCIELV